MSNSNNAVKVCVGKVVMRTFGFGRVNRMLLNYHTADDVPRVITTDHHWIIAGDLDAITDFLILGLDRIDAAQGTDMIYFRLHPIAKNQAELIAGKMIKVLLPTGAALGSIAVAIKAAMKTRGLAKKLLPDKLELEIFGGTHLTEGFSTADFFCHADGISGKAAAWATWRYDADKRHNVAHAMKSRFRYNRHAYQIDGQTADLLSYGDRQGRNNGVIHYPGEEDKADTDISIPSWLFEESE